MRIEVLVGMIASSKSTYARKRADECALVVSHDDLSAMLHCRYRYEQQLRECYRTMEEKLVAAAIGHGRDAIVDRTHMTRESRYRWVREATLLRCGFPDLRIVAVAFPVDEPGIHARRRFEHDPRGRSHEEWHMVAQHHYTQFLAEPLSDDEGFDEIIRMPGGGDRP